MDTDHMTAAPATGGLEAAGFGARSGAALLDLLVAYATLVVSSWIWIFFTGPPVNAEAPRYVSLIVVGLVWLYLTATVGGGATLGMRVAGVRVVRSADAAPPGLGRAAARSAVLLAAAALLVAVHPALLVVYLLLMLVIPGRRLPHDLAAGTVMVRAATRPAATTGADAPTVRLSTTPLDPAQARTLLGDLDDLRRRCEATRHRASVPLIVLGLLALAGAAVELLHDGSLFFLTWAFWVLAGPLGLMATAWWYRRLRLRDGAGTGERDIVAIAVVVGCGAVVGAFLPVGGVIAAVGFLAVAIIRRTRALGAAAVVFGLVIGIEQPFHTLSFGLTNAYPHMTTAALVTRYGTTTILTVLAIGLLVPGVLALRQEQRR